MITCHAGRWYAFRSTARWALLFDLLHIRFEYDESSRRFHLPDLNVSALHWVGSVRVPRQEHAIQLGHPIIILGDVQRSDHHMLAVVPGCPDVVPFDFPAVDAATFARAAKFAAKSLRRHGRRRLFR